jgi:ribosome-binding factor A
MDRIDRISSEMQRVLSEIIREDVKDPRVPLMTSVVSAKVTRDLKYAKIYISVLGTEAEKKSAMAALQNSAGFIRHQVADKMELRCTPQLTFILDESIERGSYLTSLIDDTLKKDDGNGNV